MAIGSTPGGSGHVVPDDPDHRLVTPEDTVAIARMEEARFREVGTKLRGLLDRVDEIGVAAGVALPLLLLFSVGTRGPLSILTSDVVAVEVYLPGIAQLVGAVQRAELTNVRVIRGDGVIVNKRYAPPIKAWLRRAG